MNRIDQTCVAPGDFAAGRSPDFAAPAARGTRTPPGWLEQEGPLLALAPMQDVTDHVFWGVMQRYGGADVYFTEYFRVHANYRLDRAILKSVTENPTGRPVIAQLIGNDIPALVRSARELQEFPVAAIDLNLGCPAPVVYRKCAGGGLLREPARVDAILGALRDAIPIPFTVKTRVGFDSPDRFDELLAVFARHPLDLLTVHGRTVREMYHAPVHYDLIARAVEAVGFPVLANGDIDSPKKAAAVLRMTGARGLMIGRGAIRNPWLFEQIRRHTRGESYSVPTGREVLEYLRVLYEALRLPNGRDHAHVQMMKRYALYLGMGVEPAAFMDQIRRAQSEAEFFRAAGNFLDHDAPMPLSARTGDPRRAPAHLNSAAA